MALPGLLPDPNVYDNDEDAARAAAAAAPIANSATGEGGGGGAPAPTSQQAAAAADDAAQAVPTVASFPSHSFTQHHEGASSDTTRTTMDPRREAAIAAETAAGNQAVAATDAQGKAAVAKAGVADRAAQAQSAEDERYMRELAAGRAEKEAIVQQKAAEYQQRRLDMEKAAAGRHTTYWQDKGAPAELLSIFLVGLSDRSHQLAGLAGVPGTGQGPSPVQQMLDAKIAEDTRIKMAKFEDSKEFMQLSKDDVAAAQKAKADKLAEIRDEHVVMVDSLSKKFAAIGAKYGTADAQAKADQTVAEMKQTNAKTLQDQYKDLNKTTVAHSSKDSTTEVNNEKEKVGGGPQKANSDDIAKRAAAKLSEAATDELSKIATKDPDAIREYQKAEREWNLRDANTEVPYLGPLFGALGKGLGGATSKDELLKDAPAGARRVNELIEIVAQGIAKATGGVITDSDRRFAKTRLGILGKSPEEIAKSAREYRDQSIEGRKSLEANKVFLDAGPDTSDAERKKSDESAAKIATERKDVAKAIDAIDRPWTAPAKGSIADKPLSASAQDAAANLLREVKGGGDAADAAQRARDAGVPGWMVDGLLAGRKK